MHCPPQAAEILAAGVRLVREELIPALPADLAFKARILANALDLAQRETALPAPADLSALAGLIDAGTVSPDDPQVLAALWKTTLARIAVDQPAYASYRAECARDQAENS